MPLLKCSKCHHEWEGHEYDMCDWCNSSSPITLEEKTPLENLITRFTGEQE